MSKDRTLETLFWRRIQTFPRLSLLLLYQQWIPELQLLNSNIFNETNVMMESKIPWPAFNCSVNRASMSELVVNHK